MTYPFVQALYRGPSGSFRQLRALTVHMAEGGGTVAWLTHPTNANSSHFVIEYSGRIVQMVADDAYDFSLHTARPAGPPGPGDFGIFSLDAAKAVLGDGISDPNRYMYAVEIEGYAAAGPNGAQVAALGRLVTDLRSRFPSMRGLLGHRDFQNYKPCPGGLIPWAALGGHGLFGGAPAPTPPKWEWDPAPVRFPEGTVFDCRGLVALWDPDKPGAAVTRISGAIAARWRAGFHRLDGYNVPSGKFFVQISAPGPYFGLWAVESDGEIVLPVPQEPPVPPVVEHPPIVELPPLPLPPLPSAPRSTRLPGGIEII